MNTPAYVRNEEVDEESSHLLSWDEWLREHASQLLLFARQQSRSPEDAEDILQDALVRLARKEASGEFVGGQEAWLSYVFASIRRLAVDYGRKSDRRQKREDEACASERDEDVYTDPWFSSAAADEELKQFMEMQLRKLPSQILRGHCPENMGGTNFSANCGNAGNLSEYGGEPVPLRY
ncbi:RNA polymerase sigma factor [Akkermansia muciniphila]|nr:RNA polymerase sigma factor [Akkermansia muciniphila]